jgi:IS5 family transposase
LSREHYQGCKSENKQRSSIRYIVERTFGLLKQHHGLAKARHLGIERNKTRAQLIAMSHNLKTGMNIFKQMRSLTFTFTLISIFRFFSKIFSKLSVFFHKVQKKPYFPRCLLL